MPSYHHVTDDNGMIFMLRPIMKVGVSELDADHAKLFDIIDDLNDHLLSKKSIDEASLKLLFEKLIMYAVIHFEHESKLFNETNYPKAKLHEAEHKKLLNKIDDLSKQAKMTDILKFLTSWLNDHILVLDQKFADHYVSTARVVGIEPTGTRFKA